jgi:hypothetical protein
MDLLIIINKYKTIEIMKKFYYLPMIAVAFGGIVFNLQSFNQRYKVVRNLPVKFWTVFRFGLFCQ